MATKTLNEVEGMGMSLFGSETALNDLTILQLAEAVGRDELADEENARLDKMLEDGVVVPRGDSFFAGPNWDDAFGQGWFNIVRPGAHHLQVVEGVGTYSTEMFWGFVETLHKGSVIRD